MPTHGSARSRRAFAFTAGAFVWSLALIAAALFIPAYGSATLVDENGTGVLLVVAVPAVVLVVPVAVLLGLAIAITPSWSPPTTH